MGWCEVGAVTSHNIHVNMLGLCLCNNFLSLRGKHGPLGWKHTLVSPPDKTLCDVQVCTHIQTHACTHTCTQTHYVMLKVSITANQEPRE